MKKTFTIAEIEEIVNKIKDSTEKESELQFEGMTLLTDVGYAFDGIDFLVNALKMNL